MKLHDIFNRKKRSFVIQKATKINTYEYQLSESNQIPNLHVLYKLFLGFRLNGFFVEFGAYDGEYASNTSGLADLGWKGLFIEPVYEYFKECSKRHRKNEVKILNLAVGECNSVVKISKGGALSSISQDVIDKFNSFSWAKGFHNNKWEEVQQMTLNDIFEQNNVPIGFDVLSIDVEGYEWYAIKNFNIEYWSPKIVIVELHDNNPNYDNEWEMAYKIVGYFNSNNYRPIYKDLSNTIYLRNDIKPLNL